MEQHGGQAVRKLPTPKRYITNHDTNGLSIFDSSISELLPTEDNGGLSLHLGYATTSFPTDFAGQSDLETYTSFLSTPPGISLPNGTVLRIIVFQPGYETPMHRTVSLDYGAVLNGEIELVLDSGESRILKKSDISIQGGTKHKWRNTSPSECARVMFVSLAAIPIQVAGKVLQDNHGMDR